MASLSGISSASFAPTGSSQSGLQVELAKLKKEQSACVNCASAETQAGKLNIQKLSTQIASVQSKLTQQVQPTSTASAVNASSSFNRTIDVYA